MSKNFSAIGIFIFGGSATFGTESAGYEIDQVLEMTDDMDELNSYHFVRNRPDIPIVPPKTWENDEYLSSLKEKNIDAIYANCPCSSLSQINRNASVDGNKNTEFYRVFNGIKNVYPKTFVIENAPTLIKLGYPIILDMVEELGDLYKFTIIRDYAGNHDVAMRRMRTFLVGWRKDIFNNKIPLLNMEKKKQMTAKEIIGDLYEYEVGSDKILNHTIPENKWLSEKHLFKYADHDTTIMKSIINKWDNISDKINDEKIYKIVLKNKNKLDNGGRIWDKSPHRMSENKYCPSMTSLSNNIHPVHDRMFTVREYARLMGYPDDFEFFDNCQVDVIQCIAQGVPANFIKYITGEMKEALIGNRKLIENSEDMIFIFQHHTHEVWRGFNQEEANNIKKLEHKGKTKKLFNKLEK